MPARMMPLLRALERVLARVFEPIGRVNNFIVLAVLFFVILTPLGWLLRRAGGGRIKSRTKQATTYWKRREEEASQVDFRRIY
jgi:predicted PurR-regulated permease PerM